MKATKTATHKGRKVLSDTLNGIHKATLAASNLTATWTWHFGTMYGVGAFPIVGREIVINWDEGGSSRMDANISDQQWEIFKLAFSASGRIAVLGDMSGQDWKFDYRFLEAQR